MKLFDISELRDVEINFKKHLSQFEKTAMQKLNKDIEYIELDNFENSENILQKFCNKYIVIDYKNNKYFIPILNNFYIENDKIILFFSQYILNSFKIGTLMNRMGINKMLTFKEKYTYKLFYKINACKSDIFEITLIELKEMFRVGDKYARFYDFEKNILLPTLQDLNENSEYFVSYDKIKISEHRASKIIAIRFKIKINNRKDESKIINEIMREMKNKITNFTEVYNLLHIALSNYGERYVKNMIEEIIISYPNNFEYGLYKKINDKEINVPVEIIEKDIKTLFDLHMEVLKILKNRLKNKKINTLNLLLKLYSIKENEIFLFEYQDLRFKIIYSKTKPTIIKII